MALWFVALGVASLAMVLALVQLTLALIASPRGLALNSPHRTFQLTQLSESELRDDVAIATNLMGTTLDTVPVVHQICDSAVEVAFVGSIDSITVMGASGEELAIGVKGQPCIGEL